ncbi:MAG: AbrB/MazE/SpoVT family DNA-binding domain-containing protein [Clostridia bacterium]|nr:AbrB/MazE/SpoVT family DNA-binding domain-containing protein [Clostridia bacterium]
MKATGKVRRIDDLGRIVIPKEIRKTMHIREGAQLEIFTDSEGGVIFKKYSPIGELDDSVSDYAETVAKITGNTVAVVDKDSVIAAAGSGRKEILHKRISAETEELIEQRKQYVYKIGDERKSLCKDVEKIYAAIVNPILLEGDAVGAIVMLIPDMGNAPGEADVKVLAAASQILSKQMET